MIFPNREITKLTGHTGPVHCVTYSAGLGQYILTGSSDRSVHLYNPSKSTPHTPSSGLIQRYAAHGHAVLDLSVSADNARFCSVGGDRLVFLWDVSTARTLRRFAGHAGQVNCVSFGGEGDGVVVSGGFDKSVRVWDTRARGEKAVQVMEEAGDAVGAVWVGGGEIVAGSVDGRVRAYDLRMGVVRVDVIGRMESSTGFLQVWGFADVGGTEPVTSVEQTGDGNAILVSTLDSTIRLMDNANGQVLQSYRGHTNKDYRIRSCLGLADSAVIGGSEDGQLYAWDLLEGRVIEKLKAHDGKVASAVTCNAARKEWASAGVDGTVSVWGMPS